MIDHVSLRVSDLEKSTKLYEVCLSTIGYKKFKGDFDGAVGFGFDNLESGSGHVWLVKEDYITQNVHIAFAVPDKESVKRFYQAGLAVGGRDNGKPGLRPEYGPNYYGAFFLDPDGNNIEAVTYSTT
ncbi:MAG TPA: VOC family protein [Candidatus Paceibacterota bacterium]